MSREEEKIIFEGKDTFPLEKRKQIMSHIGQSDTRPEILVRKSLHKAGLRFRKNVKTMPGKPDIVLPKYKTVIFIHGCFWHRHSCKRGQSMPSTRAAFWLEKFRKNVERDLFIQQELSNSGWKVLIVWECSLKNPDGVVNEILTKIRMQNEFPPV